jgi:hypothetical protein
MIFLGLGRPSVQGGTRREKYTNPKTRGLNILGGIVSKLRSYFLIRAYDGDQR